MINFRQLKKNDAEVIYQSWGNHTPNFTYLTSTILASNELAQHYIDATLANTQSMAFHIICESQYIGIVKALVDGHRAQVGYVIDQKYWGKGFATVAVKYIVESLNGNTNIQRIWATCALENIGSSRVLEKCGFIREGILRNWVVYPAQGHKAHDNYVYSYPIPLAR